MTELTHQKRLSRFRRSITEGNKIALLFQYFWNMIFDNNQLYCFGCGEYIPVHKRVREIYQRPYKKDPIHNICWDALPSDDFVKRLNEESLLICHLDLESEMGSVCRQRVKNTPYSIMVHMINHHGWKQIPELPLKKIQSEMLPNDHESLDKWKKLYIRTITDNSEQFFLDNELIWSDFRNIHFLKPNGKDFVRVKNY